MKYKKVEHESTLKPLEHWFCDNCGEVIKSPVDGCLEWIVEASLEAEAVEAFGFKIVHSLNPPPVKATVGQGRGCYGYQDAELTACRVSLAWLVGFKDQKYLLHILRNPSHRPKKVDEFVEVMRRLEFPYYEEARLYLPLAKKYEQFSHYNDLDFLEPSVLETIVKKYAKPKDWFTAEEIKKILSSGSK